jgi:hypothetical protein
MGNYVVAVGVVPIRVGAELEAVIFKSMQAVPAREIHCMWGNYDQEPPAGRIGFLEYARRQIGLNVQFDYQELPNDYSVYSQLFGRTGLLSILAHGTFESLAILPLVYGADSSRFRQINPGITLIACSVSSYHIGTAGRRNLVEAWLAHSQGPATVTMNPVGRERGSNADWAFWARLVEGRTIGEAFTGALPYAIGNPLALFGDPSLVMVSPQDVYVYSTQS